MSLKDWLGQTFYNDMGNITIYGLVLFVAFFILGAAIFFHELGHLIYFRYKLKNKRAKIRFYIDNIFNWHWEAGKQEDYITLSDQQYKGLLISGIALGTLPILIAAYIWMPFILLSIPYASGSWEDIKSIAKELDKDNE